MTLFTEKAKSHLKRKVLHALASTQTANVKMAKVNLFSLDRLQSLSPNLPHFAMPLVTQIQSKTTFLEETRSYIRQFNCLLT